MNPPPRQRGWRDYLVGALTVSAVWFALSLYRMYDANYGRIELAAQHRNAVEQAARELLAADEPDDRTWRSRRLLGGDDDELSVFVRWAPFPDHGRAQPPEPTVISWPPCDYGIQAGRHAVVVGYSDGGAEIVNNETEWNELFTELTGAATDKAPAPASDP